MTKKYNETSTDLLSRLSTWKMPKWPLSGIDSHTHSHTTVPLIWITWFVHFMT